MQHLASQNVLPEGKCVPKFKYNLIRTNRIPPNAPIVLLVSLDSKQGLIRVKVGQLNNINKSLFEKIDFEIWVYIFSWSIFLQCFIWNRLNGIPERWDPGPLGGTLG